jgi:hypothetical protein
LPESAPTSTVSSSIMDAAIALPSMSCMVN